MADITGTSGSDVFFFQGVFQPLSMLYIDPYTGDSFLIDGEKNTNTTSYDGLTGTDTLYMTNYGDAIFLRDPTTGTQMVNSVENFYAGDGGDAIILSDSTYTLGNISVDGGGADDLILSNVGDDILNGYSGDDTIYGGPGNDIVNGDAGNDILNGGTGSDILNGGDGNDTLMYVADGTFDGSFLAWNIGSPGVDGTDTYVNPRDTNMSNDIFNGGSGYDTLVMTDGSDTLFLDDPYNDYNANGSSLRLISIEQIDAGGGDDIIDLTHDVLTYGDIVINGGDGNDHLWSSTGNDTLNGGTGDDHLFGGAGDDTLNGDAGSDQLYGSIGNDTLSGGDGNDILYGGASTTSEYVTTVTQQHLFSTDVVFPDLQETVSILDLVPPGDNALGIAAGDLSVDYNTTATVSFVSTDAGFDNTLGFYNIGADGTIYGVDMAFPNVKDYTAGDTATINLPGAPDTDFGFFMISNGANRNSDFSNYDLQNGEFKFVYDYGKADERLANVSDNENDIKLVYYNGATEKVVVGSNNHIYHTTTRGGDTTLNGDDQVHVVSGVMDGSDGSTLRIGFEDLPNIGDADYNDVVFDLTVQSQTTVTLLAADNDTLLGGAGDDYLNGGIGDDLLVGGAGADTLFGDQGADVFLFQSLADAGDTIQDFTQGAGGDVINITDVLQGYDSLSSDINNFVHLNNNGGNTELQVNADGQGTDFVTLATIQGGVGNSGLTDLLTSGNLVVDQHIPVA